MDVSGAWSKRATLELEQGLGTNSSLVVQASYQAFETPPPDVVFLGNWSADYAIRRRDSMIIGSLKPERSSVGANYWGTGRPLPEQVQVVPIWMAQCRLGWRRWLGSADGHWRPFIQPGLSVSMSRHFDIRDSQQLMNTEVYSWDSFVGSWTVVQRTEHYRQTREMRLQNRWSVGALLDVGTVWQISHRFFIEGRAGAGFNANPMPDYSAATTQQRTYAQAALLVGCAF